MQRAVYISASARAELKDHFRSLGFIVNEVHTSGIVAEPVSDHPDMFMCRLGIGDDAAIVSYFDQDDVILRPDYPHDIAFNAACTGKYFIHNLRYTAPVLLQKAADLGMSMIDVRQGYSKCSTVIVDEDSIITYDRGLASACTAAGMDVLTISPGHVILPGYDTGFIGGASGRIGDNVYFNGDITMHPDFDRIEAFIRGRSLNVRWFDGWPLTDTGSII